jgi:ADP-ribose pyrophosphatase YjhB (NUDIX family)
VTGSGHYHAPDGTFRKVMPADRAAREAAGWRAVAGLAPVPALHGIRGAGTECEVVYEDVFASGRCSRLLADAIGAADRRPALAGEAADLVGAACDSLLAAAAATGEVRPLADCEPALYAARLAPGGRLDRWYARPPLPAWTIGGQVLGPDELTGRTLVVNGRPLGPAWPAGVSALRSMLPPGGRHVTAVTQGDVTEPNIAGPLCWLDFEHAGRNALAGDAACLLWYLLGMGGWLVPAYQPGTYARTLRSPEPPVAAPAVSRLHLAGDRIELDYTWNAGPGRRAALAALRASLDGDLGAAIAPGGDIADVLAPFLAARILGVIPLGQMSGPHALLCLAWLAEAFHPGATPATLTHADGLSSPVMGTQRVRAILVTPDGSLLTIRRARPGQPPYWVLPGGGVEPGEDLQDALDRELREELAATASVHSLLHVLERDGERQYFYLARALAWSADPGARSGPEFTDPARGEYHLQAVPLTAAAVAAIDLKPDELAATILRHLRAGTDLFTLPDLRTGAATRA